MAAQRGNTASDEQRPTTTVLIGRVAAGDAGAMDELIVRVYDQLRAMAEGQMQGEAAGHTLSATALVHEAYAKLVQSPTNFEGRKHFFGSAMRAMRQILVSHARARAAEKRGGSGDWKRTTLDDRIAALGRTPEEMVLLDEAVTELERAGRGTEMAWMRYFGGMDDEQIARATGLSRRAVEREFQFLRALLKQKYGLS